MGHVARRFVVFWLGMTTVWSARVESAVATPMSVDLNPVADALVCSADPDHNFGGAGALSIAAPGKPQGEFQSVLRFDASAAKTSFDSAFGLGHWSIQGITLKLTATPGSTFFNSPSSGQFSASWMQNDSWLEGTGKPPNNPQPPTTDGIMFGTLPSFLSAGDQSLGTLSFDGATGGTTSYSLTPAVSFLADVAGGNLVSLRLLAADASVSYLFLSRSKSTSSSPVLSITAAPTPAPEPSSLVLLLAGAGAGAWLFLKQGKRRSR